MTNGGDIHWLLGIEIIRDKNAKTISWSQRSYIKSILERFNMENSSTLSMPLDPSLILSTADSPKTAEEIARMVHVPFREAVGSLLYLAIAT